MKNLMTLIVLLSGTALYGCGSDNNNSHNQSSLRIIHAGSDAPKVNILANNTSITEGLDYGESSGFKKVSAQNYSVDVNAQLPNNTTPTVLTENYDLKAERNYSAIAIGSIADNSLEVLVIENADSPIAEGYIRLQAVHGSPAAPTVDVYITTPAEDLTTTTPTLTLNYRQFSDQLTVPAGDYQIRITPAGTQNVVFDSGTLSLTSGSDLLVTAAPNVYGGNSTSPVVLLTASGESASVLFDQTTGADLRAVHVVADAPAVNVLLNNSTPPAVSNLTYENETAFLPVPSGQQNITVNVPSLSTDVLSDVPVSLEQGKFYNAVVLGSVDASDAFDIELLPFEEDRRKVATEAKITLVHGSVSAGTVDVYITPTNDISNIDPNISNFTYKQTVTGVGFMPGNAVLSITPAGSKTVAIGPVTLNLEGGKLYGAVAQDASGGGAPLGVNGFDELN
ncbi:hypothetical protein BCT30_09885 [Enterovibrio norvegicus]|uniref:DUF4397 domain-containing protein n=1 Tax=Enterovibrio norvegicus TaxID=188144 RepID=UPI000C84587F|nr:DUF4397 domain-containing protein [Enterovibrio norvegicus]PMI32585.1 hypothetical protein BCU47_12530 [Enterovibrio norvegicus]PMN53887.1 hypothetical protein BCT30_09885 [Enterovibrio norvegicus]TKF13426.1 DUF4397 domain-containing protein [Enterovibrio norvegicus]